MSSKTKWNQFLKKGDVNSYLTYKKELKKEAEIAEEIKHGIKRRDNSKK